MVKRIDIVMLVMILIGIAIVIFLRLEELINIFSYYSLLALFCILWGASYDGKDN